MKPTLIIKNIGALATPTGNAPKAGELQGAIELIRDSYIVIAGQEILEIGSGEVPPRFVKSGADILDARYARTCRRSYPPCVWRLAGTRACR